MVHLVVILDRVKALEIPGTQDMLQLRIPIRPLTPTSDDFPSDSGWEK